MHHFVAIGEFKLELQSGKAQFGSNSTLFFSRVADKFYRWPWKTIRQLFYATASFVHPLVSIGEFKLELQSGNDQFGQIRRFLEACDLEIRWMTLKNNRAPFYATSSVVHNFVAIGEFKLELQSGNAQPGSNSTIFRGVWPRNLTDDLQNQ